MRKFNVYFQQVDQTCLVIEAESAEKAIRAGRKLWKETNQPMLKSIEDLGALVAPGWTEAELKADREKLNKESV